MLWPIVGINRRIGEAVRPPIRRDPYAERRDPRVRAEGVPWVVP